MAKHTRRVRRPTEEVALGRIGRFEKQLKAAGSDLPTFLRRKTQGRRMKRLLSARDSELLEEALRFFGGDGDAPTEDS